MAATEHTTEEKLRQLRESCRDLTQALKGGDAKILSLRQQVHERFVAISLLVDRPELRQVHPGHVQIFLKLFQGLPLVKGFLVQ